MSYDKAKVSIDLQEYEDLKKRVKELEDADTQKEITRYKKALWITINNERESILHQCEFHGIRIMQMKSYGPNYCGAIFNPWEDIKVAALKEEKDAQ